MAEFKSDPQPECNPQPAEKGEFVMLWQAIGGTFLTVFALIALIGLIFPSRNARNKEDPEE